MGEEWVHSFSLETFLSLHPSENPLRIIVDGVALLLQLHDLKTN